MLKYLQERRNIIINRILQKNVIVSIITVCVFSLFTHPVNAQVYSMNENWFIGAGGSMVSFFGDLSTKDYNPVWKTQTESDLGFSLEAGKELSRALSISAIFSHGKMKGNNPELNYYFNNKFNELQLLMNLSLKQVILPDSKSPLDFSWGLGGGYLDFKTIRRQMNNGNIVTDEGLPAPDFGGTNRSALFVSTGPGISYALNDSWKVYTSLIFRFTDSDLLDSHAGSTRINDRYSFLSIGLKYTFGSSGKSGNRHIRCTEEYKKFKRRN